MIKYHKDNQKGITLATLSVAIIIMLIITSTLIYNITIGAKVRALNNMYQDITKIKDKIDLYYASHRTIPALETKYENVIQLQGINPNDNDTYYVVDLEALENLNLTYGQDYETYKTSPSNELTNLYIINERSHRVYYPKGIVFDEKIYYTIPEESTKVEINSIADIQNVKIDKNVAVIAINAVNKETGIKQIKLFVNDQEYKTFDYASNFREAKTETLNIVLPFGEEYLCYFQTIDEQGNTATSDRITLQNLTTITTVEDLQNLATLVNNGTNTFSGQTINLMNDLDLNGSEENKWVPIGNENNSFDGIFEGNKHTINNLYINETAKRYNGLFGRSSGTIRNVSIDGTIKTTSDFIGGIVALNLKGIVENCFSNIQIETTYNSSGGIIGENNGGTIKNCISQGKVTGGQQVGGIVGHSTERSKNPKLP